MARTKWVEQRKAIGKKGKASSSRKSEGFLRPLAISKNEKSKASTRIKVPVLWVELEANRPPQFVNANGDAMYDLHSYHLPLARLGAISVSEDMKAVNPITDLGTSLLSDLVESRLHANLRLKSLNDLHSAWEIHELGIRD